MDDKLVVGLNENTISWRGKPIKELTHQELLDAFVSLAKKEIKAGINLGVKYGKG